MLKILNKILKPILTLMPDLVCYVDPREQVLSEYQDEVSKGVFRYFIDRVIFLGVVAGLILGTPLIKVLSLIVVLIQIILYFRNEE